MQATEYMMVLAVRHFRIHDGRVAVESAFAEHLRMMRARVGAAARRLIIVSPAMSAAYEAGMRGYGAIDEAAEVIIFYTLFSDEDAQSTGRKLRLFVPSMKELYSLARQSFCIQSGLSRDVWLPFEFASIVFGLLLRRRTVFRRRHRLSKLRLDELSQRRLVEKELFALQICL